MKAEYIKPENRVHQLSSRCAFMDGLSGGGYGENEASGEARQHYQADGEDNTSATPSTSNIWQNEW